MRMQIVDGKYNNSVVYSIIAHYIANNLDASTKSARKFFLSSIYKCFNIDLVVSTPFGRGGKAGRPSRCRGEARHPDKAGLKRRTAYQP